MKTTKKSRLLAILIALVLMLGAMPALAVEIDSGDYAAWTQDAAELLYEQIMAAESYSDYYYAAGALSESAYAAFLSRLSEEQQAAVQAHIEVLCSIATTLVNVVSVTKPGPLVTSYMSNSNAVSTMALLADTPMLLDEGTTLPDGLKINKTAKDNDDGTYTITLDAYVTGTVTTTTDFTPVDIVLVLDVSGSMDYCITCGKSESDHDGENGATVYKAVNANITPNNETTYYINTSNGPGESRYVKVTYCKGYGNGCSNPGHEEGWFKTKSYEKEKHYDQNRVEPKTSDNPDGTQFYMLEYCTTYSSRLAALKTAVNAFIDTVAATSSDDSDNRIAIVKFAGETSDNIGDYTYYDNNYKNHYNCSQIVKELTSVSNGSETLKSTVNKFKASGATRSDYGMQYAESILRDVERDSKKVVVMFTDGQPTMESDFNTTVANDAIKASYTLKQKETTVYTIGIFDGANPTTIEDNTNKYMNYVSSNYPDAESLDKGGDRVESKYDYYLATSSASQLTKIFEDIAKESTSGEASVKFDSETVVEDIVSDYFTAPKVASDITAKIIPCATYDGITATWDETKAETVATDNITVDGSSITVTGFDYAKNFVSKNGYTEGNTDESGEYHGAKLQISFTVTPKDGFLGGKNVPTNAGAMISNGNTSYSFPEPKVDVTLGGITVSVEDKNVYLLNDLTQEEMLKDAKVTLKDWKGDKVDSFDYTGTNNWGLETWQNAFADLSVTLPDAQTGLTEDSDYSLSASINYKGETSGTPSTDTGKINVFKPALTFKDGQVDYMSAIGNTSYLYNGENKTYDAENYVSTATVWKHGETAATNVTMIGTEPALTLAYKPTADVDSDKVTATDYVPVEVTVKIGTTDVTTNTKFAHADCSVDGCQWGTVGSTTGAPAFLLHVENIYADLTITKTFAKDVTVDEGQSFLFTITGPDDYKNDVIIVGSGSVTIKDLTIGEYTVTEDTNWSWRYTPVENGKSITLVANKKNEVTIENRRDKEQWLDGNTHADNLFKADGIDTTTGAATN